MARRKNVKRIDPRYFMDEKMERLDENRYRDLFGNRWGDEHTWKMVNLNSIAQAWEMMGKPDPARFIGDLPHDWQKPKVTQALQQAGADAGAAEPSEPASASGYSHSGPDPSKAKKTADFRMDRSGKVTE